MRYIPLKAVATGKQECGLAWYDRMHDAPDQRFELTSVQIKVRSDGTCTSSAKYTYTGTAVINVDPKKIEKILAYCRKNVNGLYSLPRLPTPPDALPASTLLLTNDKTIRNTWSTKDLQDSDPVFNDIIEIMKKDDDCINEVMTTSDASSVSDNTSNSSGCKSSESPLPCAYPDNHFILNSLIHTFPIPREENEYLYHLFDASMNLVRKHPRPFDPNESLPLGFPFHFVGYFDLHLDSESRIHTNELNSFLITKAPREFV